MSIQGFSAPFLTALSNDSIEGSASTMDTRDLQRFCTAIFVNYYTFKAYVAKNNNNSSYNEITQLMKSKSEIDKKLSILRSDFLPKAHRQYNLYRPALELLEKWADKLTPSTILQAKLHTLNKLPNDILFELADLLLPEKKLLKIWRILAARYSCAADKILAAEEVKVLKQLIVNEFLPVNYSGTGLEAMLVDIENNPGTNITLIKKFIEKSQNLSKKALPEGKKIIFTEEEGPVRAFSSCFSELSFDELIEQLSDNDSLTDKFEIWKCISFRLELEYEERERIGKAFSYKEIIDVIVFKYLDNALSVDYLKSFVTKFQLEIFYTLAEIKDFIKGSRHLDKLLVITKELNIPEFAAQRNKWSARDLEIKSKEAKDLLRSQESERFVSAARPFTGSLQASVPFSATAPYPQDEMTLDELFCLAESSVDEEEKAIWWKKILLKEGYSLNPTMEENILFFLNAQENLALLNDYLTSLYFTIMEAPMEKIPLIGQLVKGTKEVGRILERSYQLNDPRIQHTLSGMEYEFLFTFYKDDPLERLFHRQNPYLSASPVVAPLSKPITIEKRVDALLSSINVKTTKQELTSKWAEIGRIVGFSREEIKGPKEIIFAFVNQYQPFKSENENAGKLIALISDNPLENSFLVKDLFDFVRQITNYRSNAAYLSKVFQTEVCYEIKMMDFTELCNLNSKLERICSKLSSIK